MRKEYFWIIAYMDNQPYLVGGGESNSVGCNTKEEAVNKALEQGLTNFKIVAYPTINMQAASAYFRGKRLEQTKDLHEATRRLKHKVSRRRYYE